MRHWTSARAAPRSSSCATPSHGVTQREEDDVGESILPRRSLAFSSPICAASAWDPGHKVSSWPPTKPIKKVGTSGKRWGESDWYVTLCCVIIYAILLRNAYDAIRWSAVILLSAKLGRKLDEIRAEFVFLYLSLLAAMGIGICSHNQSEIDSLSLGAWNEIYIIIGCALLSVAPSDYERKGDWKCRWRIAYIFYKTECEIHYLRTEFRKVEMSSNIKKHLLRGPSRVKCIGFNVF